jgi:hypothetical protein
MKEKFFRIYSISIGASLVLLGAWYGIAVRSLMEVQLPGIRNNFVFDMAAIFSFLPYCMLMTSIFLFCSGKRIALYLLLVSIALPFMSIIFIAVAWKIFLPNLDLLLVRGFTVVSVGASPFIGFLSLILLFPIFFKQNSMGSV